MPAGAAAQGSHPLASSAASAEPQLVEGEKNDTGGKADKRKPDQTPEKKISKKKKGA